MPAMPREGERAAVVKEVRRGKRLNGQDRRCAGRARRRTARSGAQRAKGKGVNVVQRADLVRGVLWVTAALAVLSLSSAPALAQALDVPTMTVTGRAEVRVEPDMAVFTVGVETRAYTAEEARAANAEAMNAIRERLLASGAEERNLKTRNFRVSAEYQYNPSDGSRTFVGYVVSHWLEVTVTDLASLGPWLDAAIAAGATEISGPSFGVSNPEAAVERALAEAVRNARSKAETLARAAGVFLKRVLSINETVSTPVGSVLRATAADAVAEFASTAVSVGEVSVTATVVITYEI